MPSCLPSTLAISQISHSHSIRSRLFFPKAYSKEVYFNHDLSTTKKLQAGVDLVTDLLGVTLGPKGRNVVLENKYAPPKIVNDGETILKENTEEKFDKKIINERIARLSDGIAIIQVGAQTVVELKDKKLRVEDALNATRAAIEEGVVIGGGCYLLRLSMKVDSIKDFLDNEEQKWRDAMIFVDTEFPGTTYNSTKPYYVLTPAERYALLKANVEEIQPIQVGITICYVDRFTITWQFDICDFDISLHPYVPESITLLESSGINLKYIRRWGVPSLWLAQLLINSGLIGLGSEATWVVFQGGYDIAILLKAVWQFMMPWRIMMKSILPPTLEGFMAYTRCIFGGGIYDIKCWMRVCGLYGGLERLAKQLMVERKVGKPHQAGSDCLLICHVFFRIMALYFSSKDDRLDHYLPCKGQLSGFEY